MNEARSMLQALWELMPLVSSKERKRFWGLLALTFVMALSELVITGLVALLATVFGSLDVALSQNYLLWVQVVLGVDFRSDARWLALGILCVILLFIACRNILTAVHQWHMTAFSEAIGNAARERLLRFYLDAPYLWTLRTGTSEMLFSFTAGTKLGQALLMVLQVFSSALMIFTIYLGLIAVSPLPSVFILCALGLGGWLIVSTTYAILDARATAVYHGEIATHRIQQTVVHGLREMRLYDRESAILSAYSDKLKDELNAKKWFHAVSRLPVGSLEVLGFAALVGVLLLLIFVQKEDIVVISGIMGFMAAAAWRTLPAANRLVDCLTQLRSAFPYLCNLAKVLSMEKPLREGGIVENVEAPVSNMAFCKSVKFDGVSFHYPGANCPALQDVAFTLHAGEMLGVVGLSGAGKSTLVNLLAGMISPDSGFISVDELRVTTGNVKSWRRQIGYVAQTPYLFDASLAENVALSRWGEPIDREHVLKCCEMASLDFVGELKDGIDTVLGERGARLSGGQAQRVAIARALYSDPELIIFDEATSSLDLKNEASIRETIHSLRTKVTMVIVAHRLSTVEACDALLWLDKGRVHMAGSVEKVLPEYKAALSAGAENISYNNFVGAGVE